MAANELLRSCCCLLLAVAAFASCSSATTADADDTKRQSSEDASLATLLASYPRNEEPRGTECDGVSVDLDTAPDGYIFDEIVGDRSERLDLDAKVQIGDMAELNSRDPVGLVPDDYKLYEVLDFEGGIEAYFDRMALGRMATVIADNPEATILATGPGLSTIVMVVDGRIEYLDKCGWFSHQELINIALAELGATVDTAPELVEEIFSVGDEASLVRHIRSQQ